MPSNPDTGQTPGITKTKDRQKTFLSCPRCGHQSCGVHNTMNLRGRKIRTRVCDGCGCVFTTTETITSINEDLFGEFHQS